LLCKCQPDIHWLVKQSKAQHLLLILKKEFEVSVKHHGTVTPRHGHATARSRHGTVTPRHLGKSAQPIK
jgi:hypothetical protein